jgi:hypothetical protein
MEEGAVKALLLRDPDIVDREHPEPARIEVKIDEQEAVLWFIPDPTLPVNTRARELIAEKFGWHMIFTGSVLVEGLDPETVARFVNR